MNDMFNKLYSSRWGELAVSKHLPPSELSLQLPGAEVQIASNKNEDYYFIFQEIKDVYHTVRYYHFRSRIKETYTWVSDPMICLRMGHTHSFQFQLPHLGSQVFHQRDYNLLHIPHFSTEFTLGPESSLSFIDIILNEQYLHTIKSEYPQLSGFMDKVDRRLPAKFSMRNCIATTETLRWMDELIFMTAERDKEHFHRGYTIHRLLRSAMNEIMHCKTSKLLKLQIPDVNKIYQIATLLETSENTVTVKQLSEQSGISSYKLEKGFKDIFGHSVLHHRYEERMRMALRLVNDKRYNSKQVADMLGYSEPQSFSRAFKKRFGYAPYRNAPKYAI